MGELWGFLPLKTRFSATLALLAVGSTFACFFTCTGRRQRRRQLFVLNLLLLQVSWLGTIPSQSVLQTTRDYHSTMELSNLRTASLEQVSECKIPVQRVTTERSSCVRTCMSGGGCYARVRGFCVSSLGASFCAENGRLARPLESWNVHLAYKKVRLPVTIMNCTGHPRGHDKGIEWHSGLSFVLDSEFQEPRGGHLHHELEKLIAALHLMGKLDTAERNNTLEFSRAENTQTIPGVYWFARRDSLTKITESILVAFGMLKRHNKIHFPVFAGKTPPSKKYCFEEAILVQSGLGSLSPGIVATNAIRDAIMPQCGLDPNLAINSHSSVQALVLDRAPPRCFANRHLLVRGLQSIIQHVQMATANGDLQLCEQLKVVAGADIIVTPHGSQHALFLFAKHGATIIEVQPFLYYDANNILFLLRAGLGFRVYESMGMPDFSGSIVHRVFANFGWHECTSWHSCRARTRKVRVNTNVSDITRFVSMHLQMQNRVKT